MSTLAARHLRTQGATHIVVTNRSPEKAERLAEEIDGIAKPWEELEKLLAEADVRDQLDGRARAGPDARAVQKVTKARRFRPIVVVDIAVPRDAEPAISDFEGVYLFDMTTSKGRRGEPRRSCQGGRAGRQDRRARGGQFEHWMRSQGVVPTIKALREKFAQVADLEVQKTLDALARKEHTPAQQREAIQRLVQLVVNKLLHAPTTALRAAPPTRQPCAPRSVRSVRPRARREFARVGPGLPESVQSRKRSLERNT